MDGNIHQREHLLQQFLELHHGLEGIVIRVLHKIANDCGHLHGS